MRTTRRMQLPILMFVASVVSLSSWQVGEAQDRQKLAGFASHEKSAEFDQSSEAVDRLKTVLTSNDVDGLAKLLGLDAARLKASEEAMAALGLIKEGAARQVAVQDIWDRKIIAIGDKLWPLPFPLVKREDGKWAFDTKAGLEEILNRRIGENELQTIQTMHDYVMAQRIYASQDRDGDGVYEYAQVLISDKGRKNGLYWVAETDEDASPASALIENAAFGKALKGEGYFGYRYRILTGQGPNVFGGRHSYLVNGNMTDGFALIAWPVKYRETGVQTFMISDQSVIYERDLGENTAEIAASIKEFNPDHNWTIAGE
ncbi:DUF2950 family protein [Rhizobium sp. NXC24]|uniref:DUF2950 family protein n=1 Tax=Rhizobium sp. NXC24 TaxID=2048897 RepID=UPI000CDF3EE8|nr:DUF2950 family protein [Rhizobium sp. NXC24]AVA26136.1 hypothetical protein NXC24_PC01709 [Rhizobium sp. NXC24]